MTKYLFILVCLVSVSTYSSTDTDFVPFPPGLYSRTSFLKEVEASHGKQLDKALLAIKLYMKHAVRIAEDQPERFAEMNVVDFQRQIYHSTPAGQNRLLEVMRFALSLIENSDYEIREKGFLHKYCGGGNLAWVDLQQIIREQKNIINVCTNKVSNSSVSLATATEVLLHEFIHLSGVKSEGEAKRIESIITVLAGELPFLTYLKNHEYHPFLSDSVESPVTHNCLSINDQKSAETCLLMESIKKYDYAVLFGLENKDQDVLLFHRLREAVLFDDYELALILLPKDADTFNKFTTYLDPHEKTLSDYALSKDMRNLLER